MQSVWANVDQNIRTIVLMSRIIQIQTSIKHTYNVDYVEHNSKCNYYKFVIDY